MALVSVVRFGAHLQRFWKTQRNALLYHMIRQSTQESAAPLNTTTRTDIGSPCGILPHRKSTPINASTRIVFIQAPDGVSIEQVARKDAP
jgi:hypothetical protein